VGVLSSHQPRESVESRRALVDEPADRIGVPSVARRARALTRVPGACHELTRSRKGAWVPRALHAACSVQTDGRTPMTQRSIVTGTMGVLALTIVLAVSDASGDAPALRVGHAGVVPGTVVGPRPDRPVPEGRFLPPRGELPRPLPERPADEGRSPRHRHGARAGRSVALFDRAAAEDEGALRARTPDAPLQDRCVHGRGHVDRAAHGRPRPGDVELLGRSRQRIVRRNASSSELASFATRSSAKLVNRTHATAGAHRRLPGANIARAGARGVDRDECRGLRLHVAQEDVALPVRIARHDVAGVALEQHEPGRSA